MCWHRWSKWEVVEFGIAQYVRGGGEALLVRQQRRCTKCAMIDVRKQVA